MVIKLLRDIGSPRWLLCEDWKAANHDAKLMWQQKECYAADARFGEKIPVGCLQNSLSKHAQNPIF